jgi:hypothetical protein
LIPFILVVAVISAVVWAVGGDDEKAGVPIIVRTPKLEMQLDKIEKDPLPLDIQVEKR